MLQAAKEISPSVSWDILMHVKRTGGISVNELAELLNMSYMGVKQHCEDLKRLGYVDTWRRPKTTGRPEKIFRPTKKIDLILPDWSSELTQEVFALISEVQGETAPERFLYSFLMKKAEQWMAKIKGTTVVERVYEFAKLRNAEGWMCEVFHSDEALHLLEHHSPLKTIGRTYPNLWEIEIRVLERSFGAQVIRKELEQGKVQFDIAH